MSGPRATVLVVSSVSVGVIGLMGFRLGVRELIEDPVAWLAGTYATTALFAGVVAGCGGGTAAIALHRFWVPMCTAWFTGALVLSAGWGWGKAVGYASPPASDIPLVLLSSLAFSAVTAFGVSATIYGLAWLFDRTPMEQSVDSP